MSESTLAWPLILIVGQIIAIIASLVSFRRKPPLAEELYKEYATRDDLQQLRSEFLKTSGEIFDVLRTLKSELSTSTASFASQVSRLEGILSRCPGPSACVKERLRGGG